jgi:hypothetical protein
MERVCASVRVNVVEAVPAAGREADTTEGASVTVVTVGREAGVIKHTDPLAVCDMANE